MGVLAASPPWCGADQLSTVMVLLVGLHLILRANQLSTKMVLLVGL